MGTHDASWVLMMPHEYSWCIMNTYMMHHQLLRMHQFSRVKFASDSGRIRVAFSSGSRRIWRAFTSTWHSRVPWDAVQWWTITPKARAWLATETRHLRLWRVGTQTPRSATDLMPSRLTPKTLRAIVISGTHPAILTKASHQRCAASWMAKSCLLRWYKKQQYVPVNYNILFVLKMVVCCMPFYCV